jgi:hypothetical protein
MLVFPKKSWISHVPNNRTSRCMGCRLHKIFVREGKIKLNWRNFFSINFFFPNLKLYRTAACNTVLLEEHIVPELVKKNLPFYKIRKFMSVFTRDSHRNLSVDSWFESTTSNHISSSYILLLPSPLLLDFASGLFPWIYRIAAQWWVFLPPSYKSRPRD